EEQVSRRSVPPVLPRHEGHPAVQHLERRLARVLVLVQLGACPQSDQGLAQDVLVSAVQRVGASTAGGRPRRLQVMADQCGQRLLLHVLSSSWGGGGAVTAGSSRKLGYSSCARSMIAHPSAPSVTTETGKIPRSSRSTWTARSSSRRDTCASKCRDSTSSPAITDARSRCSPSSSSISSTNSPATRRARKIPSPSRRTCRSRSATRPDRRDMATAGVPALRSWRTWCAWSTRTACSSISSPIGGTSRHPQYSHTSAHPVPATTRAGATELGRLRALG